MCVCYVCVTPYYSLPSPFLSPQTPRDLFHTFLHVQSLAESSHNRQEASLSLLALSGVCGVCGPGSVPRRTRLALLLARSLCRVRKGEGERRRWKERESACVEREREKKRERERVCREGDRDGKREERECVYVYV